MSTIWVNEGVGGGGKGVYSRRVFGFGKRGGRLFMEEKLLERGPLFEEIWYVSDELSP